MSTATERAGEVLPTGVPGLDRVLGGGFPRPSMTLVAGTPGTGKTTPVHPNPQIRA